MSPRNLQNVIESISAATYEVMAEKGLKLLKKILDESGFQDSEYLEDYKIFADVDSDGIRFRIVIDSESLTDDSQTDDAPRGYNRPETDVTDQKGEKKVSSRSEARKYVKSYFIGKDNRPQRILGQFDARKPPLDKRRMPRNALKSSVERERKSVVKTSGQRFVDHEQAATAPRSLDVIENKLRVTVQRSIRNTKKVRVHPKATFTGIMRQFIDELNQIIADEFVPALAEYLR